ncbi:MAG: hypothetical protein IT384_02660 [Deltaproteobacteria bacterium]|nr:hypothetical protein [Deltaproteobacteria bacterium]
MFPEIRRLLTDAPSTGFMLAINPLVALYALLALGIGIARLVKARKDPSAQFGRWLEPLSVAALVAPVLAALYPWRVAITEITLALTDTEPSGKATHLARAIITQVSVDELLSIQLIASGLLLSAGLGLSTYARMRNTNRAAALLGGVGASLAVLSVPVLAVGTLLRAHAFALSFAGIAAADPEAKAKLLKAAIDAFHGGPVTAALIGGGCLAAGIILLGAALLRSSPPSFGPRRTAVFSLVSFTIAAALFVETRPTAGENALPIPYADSGLVFAHDDISKVPPLVGPDPLRRRPELRLTTSRISIESFAIEDLPGLTSKLEQLAKVDEMMHPARPFQGEILAVVDGDVPAKRLLEVLNAAASARFDRVAFGFAHQGETVNRPIFGRQTAYSESALTMATPDDDGAETLELGPDDLFASIAERAIAVRKGGKSARLRLGPEEPERGR